MKKMNFAKMFVIFALVLLTANAVSAVNLDVLYVKINGEEFDNSTYGTYDDNLLVERGDDLEIRVRVKALTNVSNVQVEADIYGYQYASQEEDLVSDTSDTFDMDEGDIDNVELNLMIPVNMDKKYVMLRVRVGDENSPSVEYVFQLHVVGIADEDAVVVDDYSFNPSSSINAGHAMTATVKVKNIGDNDLDDVSVKVSIPELNIQDTQYLDELEADEKETLEQFLLFIPDCAEPGVYDLNIDIEFDEYESTQETTTITVLEGDTCLGQSTAEDETVVSAPGEQDATAGSEVSFPLTITNQGSTATTYTVTVSGIDGWGTSRLSPGAQVVISGGETETVYLYVTPNEDADGEKVFVASVSSDDEMKTVPLTLDVEGAEETSSDLKKGLEIALVVLIIILIIIGLVIGFNKLRGDKDDETQTYY